MDVSWDPKFCFTANQDTQQLGNDELIQRLRLVGPVHQL